MLSSGVVCRVLFSAIRCASNLSNHSTAGGDGPEMGVRIGVRGF